MEDFSRRALEFFFLCYLDDYWKPSSRSHAITKIPKTMQTAGHLQWRPVISEPRFLQEGFNEGGPALSNLDEHVAA